LLALKINTLKEGIIMQRKSLLVFSLVCIIFGIIKGNNSPYIHIQNRVSGYQDVKATEMIIPQDTTLRWTKVVPQLVFTNLGDQTDTFSVHLTIIDNSDGDTVYKSEEQVWHYAKAGIIDTVVFDKERGWCPGEIGSSYRAVMAIDYFLDQNHSNDTLFRNPIIVGCGDTSKYDTLHNLVSVKFNHLDEQYLEEGVEIKPELIIANIGNHNEPDSGFLCQAKLFCATKDHGWSQNDTLHEEIFYLDTLSKIGFHGQETYPDTLPFVFAWTPQGDTEAQYNYNPDDIGTHYEIIGLVQLGVVGPDESDHCPYNDTIRLYRTCLFSHDVGLWDFILRDHKTGNQFYEGIIPQGTQVDIAAILYNCGCYCENNIRIVLEIKQYNGSWNDIWLDTLTISDLDWRGASNSYFTAIEFPTYTIKKNASLNFIINSELNGDECPRNNGRRRYMGGVDEKPADKLPFTLEINNSGGRINICYTTPKTTDFTLKIYNVSGELVSTLDESPQNEGKSTLVWSGLDDHGKKLPRGIYLIRMGSKDFSMIKKISLYR
jgi:hypothetical protein